MKPRYARLRAELRRLKHRVRAGDRLASKYNVGAIYRLLGDDRQAFQWWRRSAHPHDAHVYIEVGFCLQYGIGTRRNVPAAMRAYRKAIAGWNFIAEYNHEEAQYLLAVALLDGGTTAGRREARRLLLVAAEDGDYPQADDLLGQLARGGALRICRCRRGLRRDLRVKACALHRPVSQMPRSARSSRDDAST